MSLDELRAIAGALQVTLSRLKTTYDITWDSDAEQWAIDATHGHGCPLLDEDRGCSVNAVKPRQCRTFPFWDELLDDQAEWEAAKRFCPGLDSPEGRRYSSVEIRAIRNGDQGT
jgi:Fe-S-cluster containining protein